MWGTLRNDYRKGFGNVDSFCHDSVIHNPCQRSLWVILKVPNALGHTGTLGTLKKRRCSRQNGGTSSKVDPRRSDYS